MSNKPVFSRGYQESRKRLSSNSTYTRSCFNCQYFYQASGDKEEMCQNSNVLEYDMVATETNVYCLKWSPISNKDNTMFKNGRQRLD